MAEVEDITVDLLVKKYLFHGFVQEKLQWDVPTLIRVYQRLLSVHSNAFDYEEDASQTAHHLSHICKCLRLLEIGHLAPKSHDLVDKARALRIISALDDKISAKYKSHMAARRIRVTIKKEQKIKSQKLKPRPPTVQEDSCQDDVFPTVPLPKPCELQQKPVPQKTKPILKAPQMSQVTVPEAVQSRPATPESEKDFIPSGRQLQRTPVAISENITTTVQPDNLPTSPAPPLALQCENDVHCKIELPLPTSTSQIDNCVHCEASVTVSSISSQLDHDAYHKADNAPLSMPSELECDIVQPDMEKEEHVQSQSSLEACILPVPSSNVSLPLVSPETDHTDQVEISCEKKPNIIPTGQQIPRTPASTPEKIFKLDLERDLCSSNEETTDMSVAQNTALPPERCRERDRNTQDQENNKKSVEKDVCHMASIASLSLVPSPLEPCKMLNLESPLNQSTPVDGGLPVHCVFSPPSGYRDEKAPSKTNTETLEGKCSAFRFDTTVSESPSLNLQPSPENTCAQTNWPHVTTNTHGKIPTCVSNNEDKCDEAGNLEKLMKNNSMESTDYEHASFPKQDAVDKQKCLVSVEKNISALCENIEINCSLQENSSPRESDGEMNYTVQGTPLIQNATYVLSAKKLLGKSGHKETNMSSWKDLDGTYIVPSEAYLNDSISSETNITNIQEVRMDEPVPDATFKMDNDTFISGIQNGALFSTNDSDDTLEIFPHKHKASRGKEQHKVSSSMFAHTSQKLPKKVDEGEDGYCKETEDYHGANNSRGSDPECTVIEDPIVYPKVSKKRRLEKENYIECEGDPLGEKEIANLPQLDKNVKFVLKDSNGQGKKGRTKVKSKEASVPLDKGDKENIRNSQRKGSTRKKTCNVTDVNEQKETNVDDVKKEVRKRRCKEAKNYYDKLSLSDSPDSDDSLMSIEKKGTKSKGLAKKRQEKQRNKPEKNKKSKDVKPRRSPKKDSQKNSKNAIENVEKDSYSHVERKTAKFKDQKKNIKESEEITGAKCDNVQENKFEVDQACGNETQKKSKTVKGKSKKKSDEQPCTEARRGRRTCKLKAMEAISAILNDSLT